MFKDDFAFTDLMAKHAQVEKKLHWSIKVIGGPEEYKLWTQEQQLKYESWKEEQSAKRSMVIQGMEDGSLANKSFKPSESVLVHKKFAEINEEKKRDFMHRNASSTQSVIQKPSMISRIYNWFLNIKFEA